MIGATMTRQLSAPRKTTRTAQRLDRLIKYLRIERNDFAARVGISASNVSRILNGRRGGDEASVQLKSATEHALGLRREYWESATDLDPSRCIEGAKTTATVVDVPSQLARFAAERGEPAESVGAMLMTSAPSDADAVWWVKRWVEVTGKGKRAK